VAITEAGRVCGATVSGMVKGVGGASGQVVEAAGRATGPRRARVALFALEKEVKEAARAAAVAKRAERIKKLDFNIR
jgi:hypothetical protein